MVVPPVKARARPLIQCTKHVSLSRAATGLLAHPLLDGASNLFKVLQRVILVHFSAAAQCGTGALRVIYLLVNQLRG